MSSRKACPEQGRRGARFKKKSPNFERGGALSFNAGAADQEIEQNPSYPSKRAGGSGGATIRGPSSAASGMKCRVLKVRKRSASCRAALM
jgi:hypothetical protein